MKKNLHPNWFSEATVVCACGNTWKTGATQAEIRTDICSACHPFYTGEQRIVDTEGRVDKFMARLQQRDNIRAQADARVAARTPMNLSLAELNLNKRTLNVLNENGIETVQDFLTRFAAEGDEGLLQLAGIGRQALADLKRALRNAGYEVAAPVAEGEQA